LCAKSCEIKIAPGSHRPHFWALISSAKVSQSLDILDTIDTLHKKKFPKDWWKVWMYYVYISIFSQQSRKSWNHLVRGKYQSTKFFINI
jgi:hypothetical protein